MAELWIVSLPANTSSCRVLVPRLRVGTIKLFDLLVPASMPLTSKRSWWPLSSAGLMFAVTVVGDRPLGMMPSFSGRLIARVLYVVAVLVSAVSGAVVLVSTGVTVFSGCRLIGVASVASGFGVSVYWGFPFSSVVL